MCAICAILHFSLQTLCACTLTTGHLTVHWATLYIKCWTDFGASQPECLWSPGECLHLILKMLRLLLKNLHKKLQRRRKQKRKKSPRSFRPSGYNRKSSLTFTVSDKVCQPYARVPDWPSASIVRPAVDRDKTRWMFENGFDTNCLGMLPLFLVNCAKCNGARRDTTDPDHWWLCRCRLQTPRRRLL